MSDYEREGDPEPCKHTHSIKAESYAENFPDGDTINCTCGEEIKPSLTVGLTPATAGSNPVVIPAESPAEATRLKCSTEDPLCRQRGARIVHRVDCRGMAVDYSGKPLLAENSTEASRMAHAGRSWPALKESKSFDTERLNESPLFKRRLF